MHFEDGTTYSYFDSEYLDSPEAKAKVRPHSSFCLLGTANSGKSTVAREILKQVKAVPSKDNKFPLTEAEDRANKIPHMVVFEEPECRSTMIDVPSSDQFLPQLAKGLLYVDHVVLVLDASTERQDLAILLNMLDIGRLHEQSCDALHLKMASWMSCASIIVAVNKLDLSGWDEAIFDRLKKELEWELKDLGFTRINFVPTGLHDAGEANYLSSEVTTNQKGVSQLPAWFKGKSLLKLVQELYLREQLDRLLAVLHFGTPYLNKAGRAVMRCRGRALSSAIESKDDEFVASTVGRHEEYCANILWVEHGFAGQGQYTEFILIEENLEYLEGLRNATPLLLSFVYFGEVKFWEEVCVEVLALDYIPTSEYQVEYWWAGGRVIGKLREVHRIYGQNAILYDHKSNSFAEKPLKIRPGQSARIYFDLSDLIAVPDDAETGPEFLSVALISGGTLVAAGHIHTRY